MAEPTTTVTGVNPDVAWALADLRERLPALRRRRDYWEGRHASVIPHGQTLSPLVAEILRDLSDNLCDDVVSEPADRLEVTNWTEPQDGGAADDEDPTPTAADRGQLAQDLWERTRGPARLHAWLEESFALGDGYIIVEASDDPDRPPTWELKRPEQMAVRYLPGRVDTIDVAANVWRDGKRWRLNLLYGPDSPGGARIERFASRGTSDGGGFPEARAFRELEPGDRDWPADPQTGEPEDTTREWVRHPVHHYPVGAVGAYGRSLLTPVIPIQDLLNKGIADLVVAMEETALDQRYAIGVTPKIDPATGQEVQYRRRARQPGDMLTIADKGAELGSFPGTDPSGFLSVIQAHRAEIVRKGRLPAYTAATGGEVPSGLSLLVQEGRQVKFCLSAQRDAGWVLREVMAHLLTLMDVPTLPEDLDVEWGNPATRDEQAIWELAVLKRDAGVPQEQVLVEGGYDQGEVRGWLERAAASGGGRVSAPGPGGVPVASVTVPGVPGGFGGGGVPVQPAGAATPGTFGG